MSDALKIELKEAAKHLRKNGFDLSADFIEQFELKREELKTRKSTKEQKR